MKWSVWSHSVSVIISVTRAAFHSRLCHQNTSFFVFCPFSTTESSQFRKSKSLQGSLHKYCVVCVHTMKKYVHQINNWHAWFQIADAPVDLIYFNHRTMQFPKSTEASLGHGSMDGTLLARPQPAVIIIMWAVGGGAGGESSVVAWGYTATADVLVLELCLSILGSSRLWLLPPERGDQRAGWCRAAGSRAEWRVCCLRRCVGRGEEMINLCTF